MKLAFWAVRLATRTVSQTKFKVLMRIAFASLFLKEIKTNFSPVIKSLSDQRLFHL